MKSKPNTRYHGQLLRTKMVNGRKIGSKVGSKVGSEVGSEVDKKGRVVVGR